MTRRRMQKKEWCAAVAWAALSMFPSSAMARIAPAATGALKNKDEQPGQGMNVFSTYTQNAVQQ